MELLTLPAEESTGSFAVPEKELDSRRDLAAEKSWEIPRKLPKELPVVGRALQGKTDVLTAAKQKP